MLDETFISDMELRQKKNESKDNNLFSKFKNSLEWTEEQTYKFKLASFQDDLKHWLKDGTSIYNFFDSINLFLLKKVVILIYKTVFRKQNTTGKIS